MTKYVMTTENVTKPLASVIVTLITLEVNVAKFQSYVQITVMVMACANQIQENVFAIQDTLERIVQVFKIHVCMYLENVIHTPE